MKAKLACATAVLATVLGTQSASADYCRIFSGLNQTGGQYTTALPAHEDTFSPDWWGSSSRRRGGTGASGTWFENGESVRIRAVNSTVVFYVYDGSRMDGDFQAVRCPKGQVCTWNFTWMRNNMRSFNCQREEGTGYWKIPTNTFADTMTPDIDDELKANDDIKDSWVRYGRMFWTNAWSRCSRRGVGCAGGSERKYRDVLEYTYSGELDLPVIIPHRDVWISFWFHPQLKGAQKKFHLDESFYQVSVEKGWFHANLVNGLVSAISKKFNGGADDVGEQISAAIEGSVPNILLQNRDRIEMTYDCSANSVGDHLVNDPSSPYSQTMLASPCSARTPVYDFAPQIQLVNGL